MLAYRVADRRHPIFDGTGARLHGGRWNSPGRSVIYAAQTYAGALMEVLVHTVLGTLPKTHAVVTISIPDEISVERMDAATMLDWEASRRFGDRWLEEMRIAVLLVPSVVLQGREHNVLINPLHPGFTGITAGSPEPVVWDQRLFPASKGAG